MADVTIDHLLRRLAFACQQSTLVDSYLVASSDEDTLDVRIVLSDQSFIHVYYNIGRSKAAFAWIQEGRRIYGKDNSRMGWHAHPIADPDSHQPCNEIDFQTFLREVETLYNETRNG